MSTVAVPASAAEALEMLESAIRTGTWPTDGGTAGPGWCTASG